MNSINANPIGQQFAAHTETGPYTWYRNLFANAHNRCPLAKANTQYINNVVYDFQAGVHRRQHRGPILARRDRQLFHHRPRDDQRGERASTR